MVQSSLNPFQGGGQRPKQDPRITAPGDPNFVEGRYGGDALFPAAAAQKRVLGVEDRASRLQQMITDLGLPQSEDVNTYAKQGFKPPNTSFFERLIGAVSTPYQLINTAVQDVLNGPEQNATGADYAKILGQGVQDVGNLIPGLAKLVPNSPLFDKKEFERRTGMEPLSGSKTLTLAGIPEQNTWYGKVARGILDFTYQVVADPISWITFGAGGVSRKVLGEKGIEVVDQMTARIMAGKPLTLLEKEIAPKIAERHAALAALARSKWGEGVEAAAEWAAGPDNVKYVTGVVRNALADKLLPPLLGKDFKALAALGDDVLEQLPMFARGGARLTLPFGGRAIMEKGIPIPGTTGLGRKIFREPWTKMIDRASDYRSLSGIVKWGHDFAPQLDKWSSIVRGVRAGKINGHQYMLLRDWVKSDAVKRRLTTAIVDVNASQTRILHAWENVAKETKRLAGGETSQLHEVQTLHGILTNAVQSDDSMARDVGVVLRNAYGSADGIDELVSASEEFVNIRNGWVNDTVDAVQETLDSMFDNRVAPGIRFNGHSSQAEAWEEMRHRAPQTMSASGRKLLDAFAESGVKIDEKLARVASGGGRDAAGAYMLAEMIDAVSHGGPAEAQLRTTSRLAVRNFGQSPITLLGDDSRTLMVNKNWLDRMSSEIHGKPVADLAEQSNTGVLSNTELNNLIEGHAKALAEEFDIVVPKTKGENPFRPLEENQFKLTVQFMDESSTLIQQLQLADTLQRIGLMKNVTTIDDYQKTMQQAIAGIKEAQPDIERQMRTVQGIERSSQKRLKGEQGATLLPREREAVDAYRKVAARRNRLNTSLTPEMRATLGEGKTVQHAVMGVDDPSLVTFGDSKVESATLNIPFGEQTSLEDKVAAGQVVEIVDPSKMRVPEAFRFGRGEGPRMTVRGRWGKIPEPKRRVLEERAVQMAEMQGKDMVDFIQVGTGNVRMSIPTKMFPLHEGAAGFNKNIEDYGAAANYIVRALRKANGNVAQEKHIERYLVDLFGAGDKTKGQRIVANVLGADRQVVDFADSMDEFYDLMSELLKGRTRIYETLPGGVQSVKGGSEEQYALEQILKGGDKQDWLLLGGTLSKEDLARLDRLQEITKSNLKDAGLNPNDFKPVKTHVRGPDGFVNTEAFALGGEPLKDMSLEENTARFMQQVVWNMQGIYRPQGVAQLRETTDAVVRWWKGMATVTRPTFHIRNLLGGVWNNQIIGVRMRDYIAVKDTMVKFRRAMLKNKNFEEALLAVDDIGMRDTVRAAWDSGLLNSSFSRAEYRNVTKKYRTGYGDILRLANPLNGDKFAPVQAGALAMESIEDFLRLSAFKAWYDPAVKGSENVAREMAIMVHFDYQDLTQFETSVKRFVPFFVWQRRNLPLQLKVMLERPALMARYSHLMESVKGEFPKDLPQDDYAGSEYWTAQTAGTDIILNKGTPFWARVMFDPDLPVNDLLDLDPLSPGDTFQHFLSMLGPQFSTLFELTKQADYGDVNAPAPLNVITRQLAVHGLWDNERSGQIPYSVRTIFNTVFPFYKELVESPVGPSDPKQAAALGAPGGNVAGRVGLDLLKGIGVRTQTPAMTRGPTFRANEDLNKILSGLRVSALSKEEEDRWKRMSSGH